MRRFLILIAFLFTPQIATATTYYIAANGLDTNSGTSKGSPWLHAPGMTGCSNACAAASPVAGDSFIFRGGDTWHYGNSGASPYVGGTSPHWNWNWAGSATTCNLDASAGAVTTSTCIYIGVDQTWFSGGSWTRPIMNMDNALTTSQPSSCTYNMAGNNMLFLSKQYVIFDNFEWTGLCWAGNPNSGIISMFANNQLVENNYFHGWSNTSSYTDQFLLIGGNGTVADIISHNVFDGSDSSKGGLNSGAATGKAVGSGTEIASNVFWQVSNGLVEGSQAYNIHDNLFYYLVEPSDPGGTHGNIVEQLSPLASTQPSTYFFNNLFYITGEGEGIDIYSDATAGGAMYVFNNISWFYRANLTNPPTNSTNSGDCYLWEDTGGVGATQPVNFFNNTVDYPCFANQKNITLTQTFTNNHFVGFSPANLTAFASSPTTDNGGQLFQTEAVANGQGYTTSNNYAPTSGGSTIGAGNNLTSTCNALANSIAKAACKNAYAGVTYNQTSHTAVDNTPVARPSSGAWDTGAWEFSGSGPAGTPTFSPGAGTYVGTQTVTISSSGFTVICWNTTGSPATNGATNCPGGSTLYAGPITVSSSETVYAVAGGTGYTDSSVASAAYVIASLLVNAASPRQPINPNIYGMLGIGSGSTIPGIDPQFAQSIGLPSYRMGGDGATRYNWNQDASCDGADDVYFLCGDINQAPVAAGWSVDQMISSYRFAPTPTGTAPALVSAITGSGPTATSACTGNFVSSVTCTLAAGIPTGHRNITTVSSNSSLTLTETDSAGNTYSCAPAETTTAFVQICNAYMTLGIAASGTITLTINAGCCGLDAEVYDAGAASAGNTPDAKGENKTFGTYNMSTTLTPLTGTDVVLSVMLYGSGATGTPVGCSSLNDLASQAGYGTRAVIMWTKQTVGIPTCSLDISSSQNIEASIVAFPISGSAIAANTSQPLVTIPIIPYISYNGNVSKGSYPTSVYGTQVSTVTDGFGVTAGNGQGTTGVTGTSLGSSGGTGYVKNDVGTFAGCSNSNSPPTYLVTAVSSGVVTGVTYTSSGNGCSTGSNQATTHTSGSGTGLTINITSVGNASFPSLADTNLTYNMVANSTTTQGSWLNHLISTWSNCAGGGICWYQLDNEPGGWSNIHRDVYYIQPDYSTITTLGESYATLIRSKDSTAQILGPSDYGAYGPATNSPTSDPSTVYYLRNFYAYDQTNAIQTLTYLDQHSPGVGDSSSASNSTESTRQFWDPTFVNSATDPVFAAYVNAILTTTLGVGGTSYAVNETGNINGCSLGTPTYLVTSVSGGVVTGYKVTSQGGGCSVTTATTTHTSGSGSGLTISILTLSPYNTHYQFIPRMQGYANTFYPGLNGVTLSEWEMAHFAGAGGVNPQVGNSSMVDAVTTADVFGVWGYYGLQLANFFPAPSAVNPNDAMAYIWKLYRNYDGAAIPGCSDQFGTESVTSSSANQSNVSIYGATRSCDGKLTIMVINKQATSSSTTVNVSGFSPTSTADAYTYSSANTAAIIHATIGVSGGVISPTLPAYSATMFVLTPVVGGMPPGPPKGLFAQVSFMTEETTWLP